jgi:DNA-binding NarL/FixJ family response regulator
MLQRRAQNSTDSFRASVPFRNNLRTLVVDDSPSLLEAVCVVLEVERLAQVIGRAKDGAEGLQLVAMLKPDLLLMDISMPNMDGLEATTLVKQIAPATRVILMSGEETPQMHQLALAAGADGFLFKTSFPEEFASLLDTLYPDTLLSD